MVPPAGLPAGQRHKYIIWHYVAATAFSAVGQARLNTSLALKTETPQIFEYISDTDSSAEVASQPWFIPLAFESQGSYGTLRDALGGGILANGGLAWTSLAEASRMEPSEGGGDVMPTGSVTDGRVLGNGLFRVAYDGQLLAQHSDWLQQLNASGAGANSESPSHPASCISGKHLAACIHKRSDKRSLCCVVRCLAGGLTVIAAWPCRE